MTRLNEEMRPSETAEWVDLLDEMTQVFDEISVAEAMYRQGQARKRDGEASQAEVNDLLFAKEHLIRWFNLLDLKGKAAVAQAELPRVQPTNQVEILRARIYDKLKEAVASVVGKK